LRFRGFNQAEKLGSVLAERLHIPIRADILRRIKATTPQVKMKHRRERLQNMEHVFSISSKQPSRYPAVLLFDDVFTTGATIQGGG
jgi:predicted amidophosphoribosyltransferase